MSTRGRGRAPGYTMSPEHRRKIANSQILTCLIEHVEGKREMTATQVTAGIALLRKVLPDLSNVELTGKDGGPVQTEDVTNRADAFTRQIASLAAGLAASGDAGKPH